MNFSTPRSIEKINLIYKLLQNERMDAYDLADEICCTNPVMAIYLLHMKYAGMIEEQRNGKKTTYKSIPGAKVPQLVPVIQEEDKKEMRRESRDLKKKKAQLSQIKPWRDPLLWLMFNVK